MNTFFSHIDDLIAIIIVVGCLILRAINIDSDIQHIIYLGAAYAFGKAGQRVNAKSNGG